LYIGKEKNMILVLLNINGTVYYKECANMPEATLEVAGWLKRAKGSFPNRKFTPIYYNVTKKE